MNKPLIDLYKYYPEEFKCLSYDQLLIVHEYCGDKEIEYKKMIEQIEQKRAQQKRRAFNGQCFSAIPLGFITMAITTREIDHWLTLVVGLVLFCVAAGLVQGVAQSFYVNLIQTEKATKLEIIIKTAGAVIACAVVALVLHGQLFN